MNARKLTISFAVILTALVWVVAWLGVGASASDSVPANFVAQGPAGIAITGNVRSGGAVKAVVTHPTNPRIAWIGTVSGGVWKTCDATLASPIWTPLTDHMPSLSIGALELDPTDASYLTLVAGFGHWSTFLAGPGGPLVGLIRTTDGGATWSALGGGDLKDEDLSGVAPRGSVIVATSKGGQGGVWRSTDTGATFQRLSADGSSGLPAGQAYDLADDPSDPDRLYAAIKGMGGGIYRSDDAGAHWQSLGGANFGGAAASPIATSANNMKIAVHGGGSSGTGAVYAAVVVSSELAGLFRSTDYGALWTALDLPSTVEGSEVFGLHPGKQGRVHLSVVADPDDADMVYLGGDHAPAGEGGGRLFRCDASKPSGSQCEIMTGADTTDDSTPHPDSRDMAFDANHEILEVDDGGIYRRTLPKQSGGTWLSISGNLGAAESHSCAYDHVSDIVICGTQDNGTAQQPVPGAQGWELVGLFDGGIVSVHDRSAPSTRYFSSHSLAPFYRATCSAGNVCTTDNPTLIVNGSGGQKLTDLETVAIYPPIAANEVAPLRLLIAASTIYESGDRGDHLTKLSGFTGSATRALAYGADGNPDVIYAGSSDGLFLRASAGPSLSKLTNYAGGEPLAISLDPNDWHSAWVVDESNLWHTPDAGSTWEKLTGNIGSAAALPLNAISFIPASPASVVVVGASDGLYVSNTAQPGHWAKFTGALPNAVVYGLEYDRLDDVLLITTVGRGAWTLPDAKKVNLPPTVVGGPDGTVPEGVTFTRVVSFTDPNAPVGETYNATADYNDGTGAQPLSPAGANSFTLSHTFADNGVNTVTVSVTDGHGATGTDTLKVTVMNVPPSVGAVSAPSSPIAVGTSVTVSAPFTDPGILDTHVAAVAWGDTSGETPAVVTGTNTSGTATGTHVYTTAGLYTVRITVTDKDGEKGSSIYQYIVVYDPAGPFVTGSGWIDSPPGAYLANPTLTGKATLGFVAKYQSGTPSGNAGFNFHAGDFDFKSSAYSWLVTSGSRAYLFGTGTVNGIGGYDFLISADDASGGDKFRLKVWVVATGLVVFDTLPGAPDGASPTTVLGGGNIDVHP
jgi:photosystem II stability/assembly factor-like uncharacterized protein/PKD repeat protein